MPSASTSSLPQGPVTSALLGTAIPVTTKKTATDSTSTPAQAASNATPSATPGTSPPASSNPVPENFFTSSGDDLSKIASNFQAASSDSDFPQQFTPPPPPQTQEFNAVHSWGSAAMMMALIGSAFTKHPITTALNAGAGVMSAFKQNVDASNTQAYNAWQSNLKNSYDIWKTNAANAIQNHRYEMTYLSKIMSDNNANDKTKETQIMEFARATKNYGLMQILTTQGLAGAEDYLNKYANLGATLSGASDDVDALYNWNAPEPTATAAAGLPSAPGAPVSSTTNTGGLGSLPADTGAPAGMISMPGGGYIPALPESSPVSNAEIQDYLHNPYAEQIPAYVLSGFDKRFVPEMQFTKGSPDVSIWNKGVNDFTHAYGIDPVSMTSRRALVAGLNGSISKLTAQQQQARASDATFNQQWQYVQQNLFSKGAPPTNLGPAINEFIQSGKVSTGDPNTVAYATAIGTMAEEYAKVISGSTGTAGSTVNAQEYARDLFNPSYNKTQMAAAIQAAQANMAARTQSYSDVIGQMNGFITAIPGDYDSRVQQTSSDTGGDNGGYDTNAPPSPSIPPAPAAPAAPAAPSGGGGWSIQQVP